MKTEKLISEIKEAAKVIYSTLGAGYEETVYEESMAIEFQNRNIPYDIERSAEIFYKGKKVGLHRLDFVVDGQIAIELKDVSKLTASNRAQTRAYLKTLGLKVAILINFPYPDCPEPEIEVIDLSDPVSDEKKIKGKKK